MVIDKNIIEEIKQRLNEYAHKAYADKLSDKQWTHDIKLIIGELGLKNNQEVCASGFPDSFDNEWLYDLIWYENNEQGFLKNISLAMESEWNTKDLNVKYDFEKLIQAKADLRLMIFQDNVESNFKTMIKGIESYKYSSIGDKYLLAGLDWQKHEFIFLEYEKNK